MRARLDVICHAGASFLHVDGKERRAGVESARDGARHGLARGTGSYGLTLASGTRGGFECSWLPELIDLACRAESVSARRAGAALIVDDAPALLRHWAPPAPASITGLSCEGGANARFPWPLVFVPARSGAPGIEWVCRMTRLSRRAATGGCLRTREG